MPDCNTKLFNFMQWNLFTRCGTDSAWWLVMWQQFRETIICKLSLIIKDRTETSIPGLKPVLLWFSKGRQDQEFKVFLSAGTQVQLYTFCYSQGWAEYFPQTPPASWLHAQSQACCIFPVFASFSLQEFWDTVVCTIINAHLCLRAPF